MKWLSILLSGLAGTGVATAAAWLVVSSNTAAPAHNPAHQTSNIVGYGNK